jgi:hypothetical protein
MNGCRRSVSGSASFQEVSERAVQRIGDLLERLDGRIRLASLDQRNGRLGQPGPLRQFGLSQAGALARPAKVCAEDDDRRCGRRAVARRPWRRPGWSGHFGCPPPGCPAVSWARR